MPTLFLLTLSPLLLNEGQPSNRASQFHTLLKNILKVTPIQRVPHILHTELKPHTDNDEMDYRKDIKRQ